MAIVTRENIGLLNDKLTVKISKEDYLKNYETSLKKYAKNANIPGFRKGMVPAGVVKKMYGQGVFTEEVIKVAESELYKYLQTEKLDIFGQPLPLEFDAKQVDMNNPSDYNMSFEIGFKPEIKIDPSTYNVTKYVINVEDKMVEEEVERLRTRFGKMTEPETVTGDDNVLNVEFKETDGNGNIVEEGITKANSVLVKYFSESFRKNLLDKKKDDVIELQLNKAFDDKELDFILQDLGLDKEDKNNAEKFFNITITKVGHVEKADMNEEFFVTAFPNVSINTEVEFRDFIKADIAKAFEAQSRNQIYDQLYHCLLDNTVVEFPESFLKRWLQTSGDKPKTSEEVESEFPSFLNSFKWTLISSKVATDNNVTVEQNDIKDFAKNQLFSYMGMGINADEQPWVDDYVNRMMKDKKFVEDSYYKIQTDKMFAVLESQVKAKEESISYEDFTKKLHHHHH
ncbi:MAG: trigger factor [Bacteroidetes bacterium]|nr:trigger factor [Bacteroidota bacterium]